MNYQISNYIPFSFLKNETNLSWGEILWGLRKGFLKFEEISEISQFYLDQGSEDWDLIELLNLKKVDSETVIKKIEKLSKAEVSPEQNLNLEDKWTYLFLKWVYSKNSFEDFYKILFDYYFDQMAPKSLEKLVNLKDINLRPMPSLQEQHNETLENVTKYFEEKEKCYSIK